MKHYLTALLVAAMTLVVVTANAQVKVKFGPKASFTLNTMNYSESLPADLLESGFTKKVKKMEYSWTPGFNAGMFLDVRFNPTITLGTELFVAKEGAHGVVDVELPTISGQFKGDISTYWLQVPLLLKVSPFTGFNFELGPQFGYFIWGEKTYEFSENLSDWGNALGFINDDEFQWTNPRGKFTQIEEDYQMNDSDFEYYKRWDMAVTAGVSYRLDFELHKNAHNIGLIFGARYTYGIFNTLNSYNAKKLAKGEYVQEEVDSKNSSIAVYCAVRF